MTTRTLRLHADPLAELPADVETAAAILRQGGTVAFATETVYGLGANALDPEAVAKIFLAKQRPAWDPLIVHIADESMLAAVAATISPAARAFMDAFWPGPLTLLVPLHPELPLAITAGRPNVGVRLPAHPVAQALIRAAGLPIAAPSANTFGHVSPTTAAHVAADLDGRIDAILDSGETLHGLESTVVDTTVDPCVVYRPGAVTLAQLRAAWPAVESYVEATSTEHRSEPLPEPEALPSPGIGLRHYAPRAVLLLVEAQAPALRAAMSQAREEHGSVGIMLPLGLGLSESEALRAGATEVYAWGEWGDPAMLAHRLFAGLRALDDASVAAIVCPLPPAEGLGISMIDRLRKAARLR